jgi:DNA-binding MarR family transcriptional regulator
MKRQNSSKRPPLESMVCFSVYSAGLAFNRLYRGLLKGFGLTYPQFLVLVSLQHRNGQKVSELGEALFLESNTLTPLLQRLEASQLIKRQRSDLDERVVHVSLTTSGNKLVKNIGCVPPQVLEATQMKLGEIAALTAKLHLLSGSLREYAKA